MRIGIITRGNKNYSTKRLIRAANALGHRVTLLDPWDCTLYLQSGQPSITHNGRSVERLDALIPRLSSATAKYGLEVVSQFEHIGVPSVNPSSAIETARNKWRTLRVLSAAKLPISPSFAAGSTEHLDKPISRIGGYPFLIKPFEGTQGGGIMLFETPMTAKSALDTLWSLKQDYIAQRFHHEAAGRDVRVLVVGKRALGAMERVAQQGEFRANVHRGALGRQMTLTEEISTLAVAAAQAVGLGIAGVDLLRTDEGLVLLEVNPSPGFEGFETTTLRDVATEMVRYAELVSGKAPIQPIIPSNGADTDTSPRHSPEN
ncbi:MAG: RimK family alpha-L-glutamate ligase [Candidatus Poribacteria bacterium]|nr:RimK family alpha-L-glutamate ligase [Candidatus Poribacteria bacterium]